MEDEKSFNLGVLFKEANVIDLLLNLFLYCLGGGVASFLGHHVEWYPFLIGLVFLISMHVSYQYLLDFVDKQIIDPIFIVPSSGSRKEKRKLLARCIPLAIGLVFLTLAAVSVMVLINLHVVKSPAGMLLLVYVFLFLALLLPPLRLEYSGYGELIHAMQVTIIGPCLGLLFQTGELHRILAMIIFPMVFIYISMTLGTTFVNYYKDIEQGRHRLINRVGWQRGIFIHNLFILTAYLFWGVASAIGLPWKIALPVLISLPVGIFKIWQVQNIDAGVKPRWKLLTWSSYGLLFLQVYLINFTLWLA